MAYHGNSWEKKLVKLTFQSGDDIMSWEAPYWDEPIESIIRGFVGLLVADGYSQQGVYETLVDCAVRNMEHPEQVYNVLYDNCIEEQYEDDTEDKEDNEVDETETVYKENNVVDWDPAG